MAGTESLISGAGESLPSQVLTQLDKLLTDSISSSTKTQDAGNSSTVIVSSGGNKDVNVVITPPTTQTAGSVSEGAGVKLEFVLPANTGLVQKSSQTSDTAAAQQYVESVISKYIPPSTNNQPQAPAVVAQRQALVDAVTEALQQLQQAGGTTLNLTIRNIDFFGLQSTSASLLDDQQSLAILDSDGSYQGIDSLVGANDVLLDAAGSSTQQLFVINLAGLGTKTLALANVDAAVLAAPGTVKVEGATPIRITSDNIAQNISGGGGNDTLIGTGSDTLTGGAGNDVFGFSGNGKYTITDFSKTGDMLAFEIPGVSNVDQLKAKVTSVVKTATSITYNLGPDTSVTLVGVSATDLTASMIKFTL